MFDLDGISDVDTFLFADAKSGMYRRRFAIHFEQKKSASDSTYNFSGREEMVLGANTYYYDALFGFQAKRVEENPEADYAKVEMYMRQHGFNAWQETMYQRFMRTVDNDRRSELLFLYHEDLSISGFTVLQLEGPDEARWPSLSAELRQRALSTFEVIEEGAD